MSDTIWTPRYSGPGKCGVCECGCPWDSHHLGMVLNQDYFDQTGESYIAQECETYGCNQEGGLGPDGELHCGNYVDRGIDMCETECDCPPPPLQVTVTRADNGYIVEGENSLSVCEDDGLTERSDCEATARMLYAVLEAMGGLGSKHDPFRVRIAVIDQATGRDVMDGIEMEPNGNAA
jgi:hypothetical protein